jgi:hypothetical protein
MSVALTQYAQPSRFGNELLAGPAIDKLFSFRDPEED